jgi:hypothetical protein
MSVETESQEWTMSLDPISGELVAVRVATLDEVEEWERAHPDDLGDVEESEWVLQLAGSA